jgi:glycerol-1-phosphate dehydrogenase [NAD(P)+]
MEWQPSGDLARALQRAPDTRTLIVATGALAAVPAVLRRDFAGKPARIIADARTFAAAGAEVAAALAREGLLAGESFVFAESPYPDDVHLTQVQAALSASDAVPLVVGAGSLNDLTKLAAHRLQRPYLCVATAASMDGFTSFGAIVTEAGFKRTLPCPAPRAVIADLAVLQAAPRELAAAGYGDLLGKVTAGADWLIADALGIEAIDADAWALVQPPLRGWLHDPASLAAGDAAALTRLFEGLTAVGIAMQLSSSSRPASGAEHRFSHHWEMEALAFGYPAHAHGAKVGVGSVATAVLYESVLRRDPSRLDVAAVVAAWPGPEEVAARTRALHPAGVIAEAAVAETMAKYLPAEALRGRLERLREVWPTLREQLTAQLLPAATLRAMLIAAGAAAHPRDIDVDRARFRSAHEAARTIRSRHTLLDLLFETGWQEEVTAEVFAADGFWGGGWG